MRTGGNGFILGTLIFVGSLAFASVELPQRRQFDVMKAEVESLVKELQTELAIGKDSDWEFTDSSAIGAQPLIVSRCGISTRTNREFLWSLSYSYEHPGVGSGSSLELVLSFTLSQVRDWTWGSPALEITHPGYRHMNFKAVLDPRCSAHGLKYTLEPSGRSGG